MLHGRWFSEDDLQRNLRNAVEASNDAHSSRRE